MPEQTIDREDGWKGFRVSGKLDFSLVGVLARISGVLASYEIGIFVISTFNTDYVFTKEESFDSALIHLNESGYKIAGEWEASARIDVCS